MTWINLGAKRYRLLAKGWYADLKLSWYEDQWHAAILTTNSDLPTNEIEVMAIEAICR